VQKPHSFELLDHQEEKKKKKEDGEEKESGAKMKREEEDASKQGGRRAWHAHLPHLFPSFFPSFPHLPLNCTHITQISKPYLVIYHFSYSFSFSLFSLFREFPFSSLPFSCTIYTKQALF